MACPGCGCKETYCYDVGDDIAGGDDQLERCAACGLIFDVEDHAPEDDDGREEIAAGDYRYYASPNADVTGLAPRNDNE